MNREISFRGKSIETGRFVYGDLFHDKDCWGRITASYIYEYDNAHGRCFQSEVDPETVGQFTGLYDNSETKIFEGDIVNCTHWFFDGNEVEENFVANVGFRDGSFSLENIDSRYYSDYTGYENGRGKCWIGDINYYEDDYEVIGNIYEKQ